MATSATTEAERSYRNLEGCTIRTGQDVRNQTPWFRRSCHVGTASSFWWFYAIADRYRGLHRWMPGRPHQYLPHATHEG